MRSIKKLTLDVYEFLIQGCFNIGDLEIQAFRIPHDAVEPVVLTFLIMERKQP